MTDRKSILTIAEELEGTREPNLFHKAIKRIREHGPVNFFSHVRTVLMRRAHEHFIDRRYDSHESISTSPVTELEKLTIESANRTDGVHHEATPRLVLNWMYEVLPSDLKGWCFIDYGAGRGRVLIEAAQRPYSKVIGVEFAKELWAIANHNFKALPEHIRQTTNVEILHDDAARIDIPHLPSINFLFNPFQSQTLRKVLTRIMESYTENPRPIILAYLNPVEAKVITEFPQIVRCPLPLLARIKFSLLSPYRLEIYATREAIPLLRLGVSDLPETS